MLGLDEWRHGPHLEAWARPLGAAWAALVTPVPKEKECNPAQLLREWRKGTLCGLDPQYAEVCLTRGYEAFEEQREMEKRLMWQLDAEARADAVFGKEIREKMRTTRRSIIRTFPSVFGPDPVLAEATLAAACGKNPEEHRAMLKRLAKAPKKTSFADASTTDERLRCLRVSVLELLQVQRYAFHFEMLYYEGRADQLCDNSSRMLAVLAPLLTLEELKSLVVLSSYYASDGENVFRNVWRVWSLWTTECPLLHDAMLQGFYAIWQEARRGLTPVPIAISEGESGCCRSLMDVEWVRDWYYCVAFVDSRNRDAAWQEMTALFCLVLNDNTSNETLIALGASVDYDDQPHLCCLRDSIVQSFTRDVVFSCIGANSYVASVHARDEEPEYGTLLSSEAPTYLDYVQAHRATPLPNEVRILFQGPKGGLVENSMSDKEFAVLCEKWQERHQQECAAYLESLQTENHAQLQARIKQEHERQLVLGKLIGQLRAAMQQWQDPRTTKRCEWCGTVQAVNKCSRCKKARYCESSCQVASWPVHKHCCRGSPKEQGKQKKKTTEKQK